MTNRKATNALSAPATVVCTLCLMILSPSAISEETFQSVSWVIAGGGARSSGGEFSITGTIGQPVAAQSSGVTICDSTFSMHKLAAIR